MTSLENNLATFIVGDPQNVSESTKFRVFYKAASGWKAIGDFNKNNIGNRIAVMILNVPLYRVNGTARFTVRGINSKGQYSTPFLTDAVVENTPDYATYRWYKIIAG